MILKFNQYVIDIDIDKTRRFYQTAENIAYGCNCSGCRNFENAVFRGYWRRRIRIYERCYITKR